MYAVVVQKAHYGISKKIKQFFRAFRSDVTTFIRVLNQIFNLVSQKKRFIPSKNKTQHTVHKIIKLSISQSF